MCKKAIKIVLSLILVITIAFSFTIFASASNTHENDTVADTQSEEAEETGWLYRTNGTVLEKRLWSYTYGKWLTDWMPAY